MAGFDYPPGGKAILDELIRDPFRVRGTICITFCGRSGSYLLSNLLDGHPEILSLPIHAGHALTSSIRDWLGARDPRCTTPDDFLRFVHDEVPYLREDVDHSPMIGRIRENATGGVPWERLGRSLEAVWAALQSADRVDMEGIFKGLHVAYCMAARVKISTTTPLIAWQKHVPFQAGEWEEIAEQIGGVTFLVTVRNPAKAIDSHLYHHWVERPIPPYYDLYPRILGQYAEATENLPKPGRSVECYAVRFEDMHRHTEALLRGIAGHFELPWHHILLETTHAGKTFYFERAGDVVTGVAPERADQTGLKMLSRRDVERIQILFRPEYQAWGYEGEGGLKCPTAYGPSLRRGFLFLVPGRLELRGVAKHVQGAARHEVDSPTDEPRRGRGVRLRTAVGDRARLSSASVKAALPVLRHAAKYPKRAVEQLRRSDKKPGQLPPLIWHADGPTATASANGRQGDP